MIKILHNQTVPPKDDHSSFAAVGPFIQALNMIKPVNVLGTGDCLEVNFSPEILRRHIEYKLIIRRIGLATWRVWKQE